MTSIFTESEDYLRHLIVDKLPIKDESIHRAVEVPNSKKPGYTAAYRNGAFPDRLIDCIHPALNTYYALYKNAVKLFPNNRCLATRQLDRTTGKFDNKFTWETFAQTGVRVANVGAGILSAIQDNPFKPDSLDDQDFIVTIFSANRAEWFITDMACNCYSLTNTALYDTLGAGTSRYILNLTQSPVVVCAGDKVAQLLELKEKYPEDVSNLIVVVSMDPLSQTSELYGIARELNIMLYDFDQIQLLGEIHPKPDRPPTPDSVFTISFTSGTTGANPKGVVLTQRMACSSVSFCLARMESPKDSKVIMFLPLAHISERMNSGFVFSSGGGIAFPHLGWTPANMFEDIRILKPTSINLVPRIYTRLESALKDSTLDSHSSLVRNVSSHIISSKSKSIMETGLPGRNILYDNILTNKLKSKIGFDELLLCYTGSAPIAPDTVFFLKSALGVPMVEGYGLTETYAAFCLSNPISSDTGNCGPISPTGEIRLMDLPEMGYTSNDIEGKRGEICFRGPQVFQYYYKNEEETKKAFDEDGWFHSGDVGKLDSQGRISIVDRVKNFFKLAQGEYVTPEKIENKYLSYCSLINQLYVYGDSLKTYLVAVVGVDPAIISKYLVKNFDYLAQDLDSHSKILQIMNQPKIKRDLLMRMNDSVKPAALQGFEKIHNIFIDIEPLTIERNVITTTMKLRRPVASKFFKNVFDDLYGQGSIIRDNKI